MGKTIDIQKILNLIPSIPIGTKLYLREDAVPAAKLRKFTFGGLGTNEKILLTPESGEYEWQARIEFIDWERFLEVNPHLAESLVTCNPVHDA
jgi:hypothetical protein